MASLPPIGNLSSQAAVFVYKDDASVPSADADIRAMNAAEGGIRGEIHADKEAFLNGLKRWNSGIEPTNAFLCIYSHAGDLGIAPVRKLPDRSRIISWTELAGALPRGVQYLWLLGCKTEKAVNAWGALGGPVRHRLLATDSKEPWEPFVKFFAHEISIDPITSDDEMEKVLEKSSPGLAKHTKYFSPGLKPVKSKKKGRK